jgi:hypothetical protein
MTEVVPPAPAPSAAAALEQRPSGQWIGGTSKNRTIILAWDPGETIGHLWFVDQDPRPSFLTSIRLHLEPSGPRYEVRPPEVLFDAAGIRHPLEYFTSKTKDLSLPTKFEFEAKWDSGVMTGSWSTNLEPAQGFKLENLSSTAEPVDPSRVVSWPCPDLCVSGSEAMGPAQ